MGGVWEQGAEMWGLLFSFSCDLIPPLRSTWQLFPKVREQSPFWGEEVKLSLVLQFISFPLRFTAEAGSTPLRDNPQASTETHTHTHTHKHGQWHAHTPYALHHVSIYVYVHVHTSVCDKRGNRAEDELWNVEESWIKDWTKNAAMQHKQWKIYTTSPLQIYRHDHNISHQTWVWESHKDFLNLCPSSHAGWFVSRVKYG